MYVLIFTNFKLIFGYISLYISLSKIHTDVWLVFFTSPENISHILLCWKVCFIYGILVCYYIVRVEHLPFSLPHNAQLHFCFYLKLYYVALTLSTLHYNIFYEKTCSCVIYKIDLVYQTRILLMKDLKAWMKIKNHWFCYSVGLEQMEKIYQNTQRYIEERDVLRLATTYLPGSSFKSQSILHIYQGGY